MGSEPAIRAAGTCRVCDNSELVFSIVASNQRLIIECLECLSGYAEPTDLAASEVLRMEETKSRFATAQEIERAGMVDLLAPVAVFVVDGHDIEPYPDSAAAALNIEGYDAAVLKYFGADGTVYKVTVDGPEWGPVSLHRTRENRLEQLVRMLRAEAEDRGLALPPDTPGSPEAIWNALLAAEAESRQSRRQTRRRWWLRPANKEPHIGMVADVATGPCGHSVR